MMKLYSIVHAVVLSPHLSSAFTKWSTPQHHTHEIRPSALSIDIEQVGQESGTDKTISPRQHPPVLPIHWAFENFHDDESQRAQEVIVRRGIVDTHKLAYNAWLTLQDQVPPSYHRYFRVNQLDRVKNTFQNVVCSIGIGPTIPCNSHPWPFQNVVFLGDRHAENKCASRPTILAYANRYNKDVPPLGDWDNVTRDDLEDCAFSLCPNFFNTEVQKTKLREVTCEQVQQKRYANSGWAHVGSTLLHEFLHCPNIALPRNDRLTDWYVTDENDEPYKDSEGRIYGLKAYGAYLSMWKNKVRGQGVENPDNYVYFALEVYFAAKCKDQLQGDHFKDPPRLRWIDDLVPTFHQDNPVVLDSEATSTVRPPDPEPA